MSDKWWSPESAENRSDIIMRHVEAIERNQFDLFNRFERLAFLYDPSIGMDTDGRQRTSMLTENVVASNVDTVTSVIASTEVEPRITTDGADWSAQRQARHLGWYTGALGKKIKIHEEAVSGFKWSALKGTGVCKVYIDGFKRIRAEDVPVDDIVVDNAECRTASQIPSQMAHRKLVDRLTLAAEFSSNAEDIENLRADYSEARHWAGYRPVDDNQVVCCEIWKLPIGVQDEPGYAAGYHAIVADGIDLLFEEYHEDYFPFAVFRWSDRPSGWYGIGGAERIVGQQRVLNKSNWQIDRQHDQFAMPTTYVGMQDAALTVRSNYRIGNIVPIKGDIPKTVIPQAVSPETYQRRNDARQSAYQEFGVSEMAARSAKPAGLDSGVALREYRDQTTQRFAQQEKRFEGYVLRIHWLALQCAKKLGDDAPDVISRSRFGNRFIKWNDVDMGEIEVQLEAASSLARTPAGRQQLALEWAQAGVISQDEARRLMRHADTDKAISLYTAAIENLEMVIEQILDGELRVPEPYQNLKLGIWRFEQSYLEAQGDGAPEEILEGLRQWMVQAAAVLSMQEAPAPAPMLPGGMPGEQPQLNPMDPTMGPPVPEGAPGDIMTGAGVSPADLI